MQSCLGFLFLWIHNGANALSRNGRWFGSNYTKDYIKSDGLINEQLIPIAALPQSSVINGRKKAHTHTHTRKWHKSAKVFAMFSVWRFENLFKVWLINMLLPQSFSLRLCHGGEREKMGKSTTLNEIRELIIFSWFCGSNKNRKKNPTWGPNTHRERKRAREMMMMIKRE